MVNPVSPADYGQIGGNNEGLHNAIQAILGNEGYSLSLLEEIKEKQGVLQAGGDAQKWAQAMNSAILIWNQNNPTSETQIRTAFGI